MANRIIIKHLFVLNSDLLMVYFVFLQIQLIYCLSTSAATAASSKSSIILSSNDLDKIHETVVIPSSPMNSEQEAKLLYDKALKQYGSFGQSLRTLCQPWISRGCHCSGTTEELTLLCRGVGFTDIPMDIPVEVVKLDLGNNNITQLPSKAFIQNSKLEELVLSDNMLLKIEPDTFYGLEKLKRISLHNAGLSVVPDEALKLLIGLQTLQLDGNDLLHLDNVNFGNLQHIRTLRLEGNSLERIPIDVLQGLPSLEVLNMGSNQLKQIQAGDFPFTERLHYLFLKRNRIAEIEYGGISNLTQLKILDLEENLLSSMPVGLDQLIHLQELFLGGNKIKWISKNELPKNLITLDLRANPLMAIKTSAFQNMARLRKLILSDARNLKDLPSLEGCTALEILRVDRAKLTNIPNDLCNNIPRLRSLELKSNKLRTIPDLNNCRDLRILDLSGNRIDSLHGKPFRGLGQLHDLLLSYNEIESIPYDAFYGIPKIQLLDLEGNKISFIQEDSFSGFIQLEDLNLGNNIFPTMPKSGLHRVLHLKTFNNPKLKEFPPPETFPRIQTLILSYAYHCCPFLPLITMRQTSKQPPLQEAVLFPTDNEFDMSLWNSSLTDIWPQLHNLSKKFGSQINDLWDSFGQDFTYPGNLPTYVEEYFEEETNPTRSLLNGGMDDTINEIVSNTVQCLPTPGPFLPCQDLFDWWTLRCGVWVVFLLAMLGNGTVVFVLIFSRSKMDVPRFLVCNLAAADFFMGIYLGMLAVVDASTLGEFRMYAIPWQMSVGCQIAGFLAVLSSELSVFTLAVITLERNYAITHAMHLNKRLSLRHAGYIMIIGWIFALGMALLPLFGISDYRKFAVCLPFETTTGTASLTYVVFLMFINGLAFLILMGCYLKMYCAIRGSQAWNSNDSRIAKRMALLVFTDFICWSPIAFLSLTAVFGLHLISLEQAKVFTVFVLPLNSCCNPFLYAIMTKQFKKDCVMICKAIEESRVTRGIGRCRHSSNFSNRQTPGNTNSLAERSSKELPPLLVGVGVHGQTGMGVGGHGGGGGRDGGCRDGVGGGGGIGIDIGRGGCLHPSADIGRGGGLHQQPPCACAKLLDKELPMKNKHNNNNHNNNNNNNHNHNNNNNNHHNNHHHHHHHHNNNHHHHHHNNNSHELLNVSSSSSSQGLLSRTWDRIICTNKSKRGENRRDIHADQYAYQIAEIQQKQYKRAGSVSSENYSSSRSDSWRHGPPPPHHCGIPLRILDSRRRHSSWLVARKTSQDSNLSSSRNDSSASATTASTSTFRMSRSSAGSTTPLPQITGTTNKQSNSKPRLVRQQAVQEECHQDLSGSSPRLAVRFLPTIPSAADSSVIIDDDTQINDEFICNTVDTDAGGNANANANGNGNNNPTTPFYTILHSGNTLITTLSSPKIENNKPP